MLGWVTRLEYAQIVLLRVMSHLVLDTNTRDLVLSTRLKSEPWLADAWIFNLIFAMEISTGNFFCPTVDIISFFSISNFDNYPVPSLTPFPFIPIFFPFVLFFQWDSLVIFVLKNFKFLRKLIILLLFYFIHLNSITRHVLMSSGISTKSKILREARKYLIKQASTEKQTGF